MLELIIEFITSERIYLPILYIAIGILLYNIIAKTITKVSKINIKNHTSKGLEKRKTTVISLINNIIKYVIAIIIIIMILNLNGINTTSILASLGVVSLIIGLAFQDIIKDLLAGIFLIFDNAYAVGDWIEINGFKGEVISFGLKTTKIRAYTGEVKTLNNSSFTEVINYNLSNTKFTINVPVNYNTDINNLEEILNSITDEIKKIKNVYNINLQGIYSFEASAIIYTIEIECAPNTNIEIKRKALRLIKEILDQNKIDIPYNKLDVHIEK